MGAEACLLPLQQLGGVPPARSGTVAATGVTLGGGALRYYRSGTAGIHHILRSLRLTWDDEIFITTTSESTFVSSCVSATAFNYARLSRRLGPATRVIWIIHEFGFPHPRTLELVEYGRAHAIPVIEDSAHSMDSFLEGHRLGSLGDVGLYSLPKSLPVPYGGVVQVNRSNVIHLDDEPQDSCPEVQAWLEQHFDDLAAYSGRRRQNYRAVREAFASCPEVFGLSESVNPFVFAMRTPRFTEIYRALDHRDSGVELARTYVRDWVLLPVNQFITNDQRDALIGRVQDLLR